LLASLLVFGCFPRLLTEKITPDAEKIVSMAARKAGGGIVFESSAGVPPAQDFIARASP
jgi:hypothetical protein